MHCQVRTKEVLENWHKRPFQILNRFGYNNVPRCYIRPATEVDMSPKFSTNCRQLFLWMMDKIFLTPSTLSPWFLLSRIINELSFCLLVMLEAAASWLGPTIGRGKKPEFLCLARRSWPASWTGFLNSPRKRESCHNLLNLWDESGGALCLKMILIT